MPPVLSRLCAHSLDHENSCPCCHKYLFIKFAATGQNAGHHYINCPPPCKYFYPFPRRDTPPTVAHQSPPPGYVPPPVARPMASAPMSRSFSTTTAGSPCRSQSCGKKASPACPNSRFKSHCIVDSGGCTTPGHQPERLTARQQQKLSRAVPASAPTSRPTTLVASSSSRPAPVPPTSLPSSSTGSWLPGFDSMGGFFGSHLDLPAPPPNQLQLQLERDAEAERAKDLAQDKELEILSDPHIPLTEEELKSIEDARLAIAMAASKRSFEAETRQQLPISASSYAHLSPSLSAFNTSALSPIYSVGKEPQSVSAPLSGTARPRKTTQMSAAWMREYQDNTAADAAAVKRGAYKSSLDLSSNRRFNLVFWTPSREGPMIKSMQDLPRWPLWALSDSPPLITRLDIKQDDILELYDTRIRLWKEIEITYTHKLSTDVPGSRFKASARVDKGKRKASDSEAIELPDSDDEFPASIPLPPAKRPRLAITIPDSISDTTTNTSASRLSTPATTPMSPSLPAASPTLPVLDLSLKFPRGLTVRQVVDGFQRMGSVELRGLSMSKRFVVVYSRPWVKQTYQDAVTRWTQADDASRREALAADEGSPLSL
ncbi:hypothetical protein R3P38DRAFT_3312214 [Favolaschia claudopus]|uniref:Uncharacterized protein n=1 Tax=Favolaschia claudopus TaxID=2862362 RepID=A0AAW0C9T3_9AGAR